MIQMVASYLPSKNEVLSSIPSATKKKKSNHDIIDMLIYFTVVTILLSDVMYPMTSCCQVQIYTTKLIIKKVKQLSKIYFKENLSASFSLASFKDIQGKHSVLHSLFQRTKTE
jgi:hypothetical protein